MTTTRQPSIPHWEDDSAAWDRLKLGDWLMPGVWTVSFALRREVDVKKAQSSDGGSLTDKGYRPSLLTLRGRITGRDEWAQIQDIMPYLHPKRAGVKPKVPLAIEHPKTLLAGIRTIVVHEIDAVDLDNGVLTIELRGYEYIAPKPVPKPKIEDVLKSSVYLEPPRAIARFPGMRGILVDETDPDNPVLDRYARPAWPALN